MTRLTIALLIPLVFLGLAALVAPSFIDWNAHKPRIAGVVARETGLNPDLAGNVSLTLLPRPALSLGDVTLSGDRGDSPLRALTAERLDIRLALLPLLTGAIEAEDIVLVRPAMTVDLGALASGRANDPLAGTAALRRLQLENASLRLIDEDRGIDIAIPEIDGRFDARDSRGPFDLKGRLMLADEPAAFQVSIGRIGDDGSAALGAQLLIERPATGSIRFNGRLGGRPGTGSGGGRSADGIALTGRLKAEGPDGWALLAALPPLGALAADSPNAPLALDLTADLGLEGGRLTLTGLSLRLGDMLAKGLVGVRFGQTPTVTASLELNRLDIDRELARWPDSDRAGSFAGRLRQASVPEAMHGSLSVAVGAINWRGQIVRQARFTAEAIHGRIAIGEASAFLPGDTELRADGTVENSAAGLAFDGKVRLRSSNIRGLAEWLGADSAAIPEDRLRQTQLAARLHIDHRAVALSKIDGIVDNSRLGGAATIALRSRPSFGLDIAIDRLNLDAYLAPASDAPATANMPRDAFLARLAGFDSSAALQIGALTWHGVNLQNFALDAYLYNGALALNQLSVGDLSGLRASAGGRVENLAGNPQFDIVFDGRTDSLARTARGLDLELPAHFKALREARVNGKVSGRADRLSIDADGEINAADFTLQGFLGDPFGHVTYDGSVAVHTRDLALLLGPYARGFAGDGDNAELKIDGHGDEKAARLRASATVNRLEASFDGDLLVSPAADSGLRGTLALRHPSLDTIPLPDGRMLPGPFGAAKLVAAVDAGSDGFRLDELVMTLGNSDAEGGLAIDWQGPRTTVAATLDARRLDLAPLVETLEREAGQEGGPAAGGGWPRSVIDFSSLLGFDGTLTLHAAIVDLGATALGDMAFDGALKAGRLEVRDWRAGLFDGAMTASGSLDVATSPARVAFDFRLDNGAVDALPPPYDGMMIGKARGDLHLRGESAGRSIFQLVRSLDGEARISGRDGVLRGLDLAGLLDRRGERPGIAEARALVAAALDGGETPFAHGGGAWRIERGVATTEPTVFSLDGARAILTGRVDLDRWETRSRLMIELDGPPGAPPFGVGLSGPLLRPDRDPILRPLATFIADGGFARN
ncbi:AsmA family protein [Oceanibacterium hippocampi]|uniref:Putative assembly protein n=1 Tax=Oceanibacterium hippocampi TaxID=745714 RepID=A0A1Y5TX76_9PROT|nr:AsmA family protein [Oceanibacterium hippocampi]SLN70195.1 putative assembly protein [Oceanibacterium hippocampi]